MARSLPEPSKAAAMRAAAVANPCGGGLDDLTESMSGSAASPAIKWQRSRAPGPKPIATSP